MNLPSVEKHQDDRLSTGIAGFDDLLGGGFPRGHFFLVEGEPGAGKTTLGLQFLTTGAKNGEEVLYHDFSVKTGGIVVYPRLVAGEHRGPSEEGTVQSGLPALDALWSGGIDRGTSSLFLGPAGSGKSTLAMSYAVTAAKGAANSLRLSFLRNGRALSASDRLTSTSIPLLTSRAVAFTWSRSIPQNCPLVNLCSTFETRLRRMERKSWSSTASTASLTRCLGSSI